MASSIIPLGTKKIKHLQNSPYTFSPARFSLITSWIYEYYCVCPIRIQQLFFFSPFLIFCCPENSLPLSGKIVTPNTSAPFPFSAFLVSPSHAHLPTTDLTTANDSSQTVGNKLWVRAQHQVVMILHFLISTQTVNSFL